MKQKIILILLTLWLPFGAWADVEINGIYYNLVQKAKIAEVTNGGTTGRYSGNVVIPESVTYEGVTYSVTTIYSEAFNYCYELSSISIPNTVTSIGNNAFSHCSGLTSITIPNSVTSIGSYAFYYCSGLTSATIPNSVTSIGNNAFSYCSGLTSITIPNSVTSIQAFSYCSGLTSVTIPNSVTSIGGFSGCSGLTSVTIPNSVTSIMGGAFSGCSGLTSVTIPDSVRAIGRYAFEACTSLKSVEIPNSVQYIGSYAFYECSNLENVTIGSSVINIGNYSFPYAVAIDGTAVDLDNAGKTFALCKNLMEVKCLAENVPSTNTSIFDESLIDYCTLYVPEGSVSSYQSTAPWSGFGTIKSLNDDGSDESVLIDGIYYVLDDENGTATVVSGETAYTGDIDIPSTITHESTYYTVTAIGEKAFQGCNGLTSIYIPESVTTIGNYAFDGCNNLTKVTVVWTTPIAIDASVFSNRDNATLYVPMGSMSAYNSAENWNDFNQILELDEDNNQVAINNIYYSYNKESNSATVIGATKDLIEVSIPNQVNFDGSIFTVTAIAKEAFKNHGMTSVSIPYTIMDIGYDAFRGCKNLVSMNVQKYDELASPFVIQEGITGIDYEGTMDPAAKRANLFSYNSPANYQSAYDSRNNCNAFIHTASNTLVAGCQTTVIPDNVVKIGDHAFYGQTGITSISVPASVTILGSGAFYDCTNMNAVELNEGLTNIGSYAFQNCGKLTSIKIPTTVKSIGESAFTNCKTLKKVIVPDISAWCSISFNKRDANPVFKSGCIYSDENTEIKELVIPEGVESIGGYAFYNCDGITSITLPESLTAIGTYAFYAADAVTEVTIPASVTDIGENAFTGSDILSSITVGMTVPPTLAAQIASAYRITLYVPHGTKALYEAADYWKDFMQIIELEGDEPENPIEVTDISLLDDAVYIEPFTARIGSDVNLMVKLKNKEAVTAYGFELVLPEGLSIARSNENDIDDEVTLSDRHKGHSVTSNVLSNDTYKIAVASTSSKSLTGNDGVVASIKVHVADGLAEGFYPIYIKNPSIVYSDATKPIVSETTTSVKVENYLKGDVDGDGVVDLADAVLIINYYVGKPVTKFIEKAAYVDNDDVIDLADAVLIINYYVGRIPSLIKGYMGNVLDPQ